MGDHLAVFNSLRELFPQVDARILKAVAIEHQKDIDSAVVAVLDDVMPFAAGSVRASCTPLEAVPSFSDSVGTSSGSHIACEAGSSSLTRHDIHVDGVDGNVDSTQHTSSKGVVTETQENVVGEPDVGRPPSYQGENEQPSFSSHPVPELDDNKHDSSFSIFDRYLYSCAERIMSHSEDEVLDGGHSENEVNEVLDGGCLPGRKIELTQMKVGDSDKTIPVWICVPRDYNSLTAPCDEVDKDDVNDPVGAKILAGASNDEVLTGILSIEKDAYAPLLNVPIPDIRESSLGHGVLQQKDTNSDEQQSSNIVENGFLSSKTDMLPDLNLDHFASTASTHLSHSVSIESLEESIADAKNNKNDLLPFLELVTKMIEDVEHLEEKAKVARHESSVAGIGILTKVEELKEMLNHAMEANDMHAGEVYGEKSILTTEARELQSRLQRLSDERNSYLVVIDEVRQTLEDRLVAARQEIEAAEKEKAEKESSAQALLSEQEKEMNYIVEESRKLQKEAEENLKLKNFLLERGRIVDMLQGEMAVICEDVSQLKRIVDGRLSWSKLQRSTISSLSSSLHSSLHKSVTSVDSAIEAVESTDKHTVTEVAGPVAEAPDGNERTVEALDGCDMNDGANSKRRSSGEDGWEFC